MVIAYCWLTSSNYMLIFFAKNAFLGRSLLSLTRSCVLLASVYVCVGLLKKLMVNFVKVLLGVGLGTKIFGFGGDQDLEFHICL